MSLCSFSVEMTKVPSLSHCSLHFIAEVNLVLSAEKQASPPCVQDCLRLYPDIFSLVSGFNASLMGTTDTMTHIIPALILTYLVFILLYCCFLLL